MQSHGASLGAHQIGIGNEKSDTVQSVLMVTPSLDNCLMDKDICSPNLDRRHRTTRQLNSLRNRAKTMPRRLAVIFEANSEVANF